MNCYNDGKKILTPDEIIKISIIFQRECFLDQTAVRDWTKFVINASTTGVSEFDIDQFALSEEEFSEKYEK